MNTIRCKRLPFVALLVSLCGCFEYNAHPTHGERDSLTDIVQLTSGFAKAGEARFSPDMQWITFKAVAPGERSYGLYVARLLYEDIAVAVPDHQYFTPLPIGDHEAAVARRIRGLDRPIRVTPVNSRGDGGCFSPDGFSFAFASTAGKEHANVPPAGHQPDGSYRWSFPPGTEIFRVDNWAADVSLTDASRGVDLAQHPLTHNAVYDGEPAFSNDGKWIAFASARDGASPNLYAMHADGSHVVRLTNHAGYDGGPSFSPNGKRLVYRGDRRGNGQLQIFVADVARDDHGEFTGLANEHALTDDEHVNVGPAWHPDGRHVVYATSRHGLDNYELYVMDANDRGRQKTRLTFSPGTDILPVCSPDGQYLMWTSKRAADKTNQVFVARFELPFGS